MKNIFVIDWTLIPLFLLSAGTGIKLHIVGHTNNHEIWHNWAVFHVVVSLIFLTVGICHIKTHRNWYKGITNKGVGVKSKVTLVLSVAFMFVAGSGIVLLCVEGANSNIGLWHYTIGILTSVLSVCHTLKRIPILSRYLKK